MIFVTLGTQDKPFVRLLEMVQKEIDEGNIKDEVVVQAGFTKFDSDNMKIFDYISNDEFENYLKSCNFIITHGGVGNILSAMKYNKKIIAVARLGEYGEHTNNHQLQIIDKFYEKGFLLKADENNFSSVLKELDNFNPITWNFDNSKFVKKIEEYIDSI